MSQRKLIKDAQCGRTVAVLLHLVFLRTFILPDEREVAAHDHEHCPVGGAVPARQMGSPRTTPARHQAEIRLVSWTAYAAAVSERALNKMCRPPPFAR